ncbi:MAG: glycosyltransferase, partial [Deltaproteobacteria bacterium]|nr:glycosyltransferase [Deltaproteobacteria bacterium]
MSRENAATTRIALVTPAGPTRRTGNRISGNRWARILRASGHRVTALDRYERERCDLLIALHARRSHPSIRQFHDRHPDKPIVVVLTGTDLYRDIHEDEDSRESLHLATRLVVLQRKGLDELAPALHEKTRVIYQSAPARPGRPGDRRRQFTVTAVGHMRPEKDPFRTAMAVRSLPRTSRIQVVHIGAAFGDSFLRRAEREAERNPRYRWLGDLPHWKTRQLLANSHLTSITSRMEGSSNVLCEALASGVPVA